MAVTAQRKMFTSCDTYLKNMSEKDLDFTKRADHSQEQCVLNIDQIYQVGPSVKMPPRCLD